MHECGIVHRDIKPDNIIISSDQLTVCIVDFGVSCCVSDEYSRFLNKIVGTPGYIDPILLHIYKDGLKITDELRRNDIMKTDLFSIGSTFVYMVTGQQMIAG